MGIEELRVRRDQIIAIAARRGALDVRVFGSVVRGETRAGSDVDFLVRFRPGTSLLDHAGLVVELEDLLGCPVDVVPEKSLRERVRERTLREAVPL